jgi:hypothetical protein
MRRLDWKRKVGGYPGVGLAVSRNRLASGGRFAERTALETGKE